ncbi:hypothetical protein QBC38DRAFT_61152 [Podospora fimiseda]|uniref:Fatty acid hydroxylase domain-containing protein n=1 Tax=Podospora fimiseda TaxID=252190 RepID=A0AAN6YTP4_9PEZI|nr:hypothetical protein QBC38DRAFT_61152 [Podospora fimiseda]
MDILLSLPVVSYFWSTSLTSWSTSLNLLFFYMTWSTLVLSHSPLKIEIVGTTAIRLGLWFLPSILFLLFDALLPSLSETIKYSRRQVLPAGRDAKTMGKLIGLAVFNLGLETIIEAGLSYGFGLAIGRPVFKTSTTLPLPWGIMKHVGVLFGIREVVGYWIHRGVLHGNGGSIPQVAKVKTTTRRNSKIPSHVLKLGGNRLAQLHCSYAHGIPRPTFSLQKGTDHPVAYLLHRFVPVYFSAVVLSLVTGNLHLLTYFVFVGLTTMEETMAMSGYSIIPGIVMGGIVKRTAMHYESGGKGNYGSWGVLDWVCGTGLGRGVINDFREVGGRRWEEGLGVEDGGSGFVSEVLDGVKMGKTKRGGARKGGRRRKGEVEDDEWRE